MQTEKENTSEFNYYGKQNTPIFQGLKGKTNTPNFAVYGKKDCPYQNTVYGKKIVHI